MQRENCYSTPIGNEPKILSNYWENLLDIHSLLWKHWLEFYIPMNLQRQKWTKKIKNLSIGDIVLIADPSVSNSWRLAKVIDLKEGSQDQVRKIKLILGKNDQMKIKKGITKKEEIKISYIKEKQSIVERPTSVVIPLDLQCPQ